MNREQRRAQGRKFVGRRPQSLRERASIIMRENEVRSWVEGKPLKEVDTARAEQNLTRIELIAQRLLSSNEPVAHEILTICSILHDDMRSRHLPLAELQRHAERLETLLDAAGEVIYG